LSILSESKVATPATAATGAPPASVPTPGFGPSASATSPVKRSAVLPSESCAATRTAGLMTAPAVARVGSTMKASRVAGPAVIVNARLVCGGNPRTLASNR
jgi:hypothetical protein